MRPASLLLMAVVTTPTFCAAVCSAKATRPSAKDVARGRYLVSAGGCSDCHTPWKLDPDLKMPVPDTSRLLSGHPEGGPDPASSYSPSDLAVVGPTFTSFRLPFGTVYAANLTPDAQTGLGSWTDERFVKAMKNGRHLGDGRPILPPMPWMEAAALTDDDLRAVFAFLKTIPAVRNTVPPPKVPADVLRDLGADADGLRAGAGPQ
jgi:hypothetical protein